MIGSLLIKLRTLEEIKVLARGGEDLYRLVFDILNKNDKKLAKEIHGSKREKPLTVSPLLKGAKSYQNYSLLFPHQGTSFRITYLRQEFLEPIIKGFLFFLDQEEPIKFSEGKILIERVDWQQGNKANFTSFEEIYSCASDERKIILEFCSPTSFQSKRGQKLFPLPDMVFSSLQKKWNAFSEIKIPYKVQKEFEKIPVIQFRLKTEFVNLSDLKIIGFMGKVIYELPEKMNKEGKSAINALADFAFYSGVGSKTLIGMGQARRIINPVKNKAV